MTGTLRVHWLVTPMSPPQPHRHCATCGKPRPFQCSGRVRLNANGCRLDAWLIYRCTTCDRTWNLPLLERVTVSDVPPDDLSAMQTSDPAWVAARAFDMAALRRHATQVLQPDGLCVIKCVIGIVPARWSRIALTVATKGPVGQRLDRLLAAELHLSRSRLKSLQGTGGLCVAEGSHHALKSPLSAKVALHFDLTRMPTDAAADLCRTIGTPTGAP